MTDQTTWKSLEKAFHIAIKGHLNVRHQAYVMGKLREIVQVPYEAQAREIASLRNIISKCATACGAAVSVECSEEFMAMLPDEIRIVMTGKSLEIERLQLTCNSLDDQNDRIYAELAALKAQPRGVVLPPHCTDRAIPVKYRKGWNCCISEVARLNQQPASGGDDAERAAFEAWYLGHFYMGDKQCGLEWLSTEPCGGYRHQHPAEQWIVWQARAALSAPSHGEQVREWIPVSERLPEPWTDVLAYGVNHRSHSYVVAGVFSGTWASQETEEATRFEPTHWMPLPAAPSAGSQEQGE